MERRLCPDSNTHQTGIRIDELPVNRRKNSFVFVEKTVPEKVAFTYLSSISSTKKWVGLQMFATAWSFTVFCPYCRSFFTCFLGRPRMPWFIITLILCQAESSDLCSLLGDHLD